MLNKQKEGSLNKDEVALVLEKRDVIGKQVRQLRREGVVPAVIHDHGRPSIHVMASYQDMYKAYQAAGKRSPIRLTVGTHKYLAMIKDIAIEPKKYRLQHIVFNAVRRNEKVEAEVPIHIIYGDDNEKSPAERLGLIVLTQVESVEVMAVPDKIPSYIEVNGEKLAAVGDHITIADLLIPEGVETTEDPNQIVASVYEPSALQAANEAAGGEAEEPTAEEVTDETAEADTEKSEEE